jgi:hypothetical protein
LLYETGLAASSTPMTMRVFAPIAYGGTVKFFGAGMLLNTRPDKSYFEPWHGQ